jgi:hypothetical protein
MSLAMPVVYATADKALGEQRADHHGPARQRLPAFPEALYIFHQPDLRLVTEGVPRSFRLAKGPEAFATESCSSKCGQCSLIG